MREERLVMMESIAKKEGQLDGSLALELIEKVLELEERLDRVRELVRIIEEDIDCTTLTQFRLALDGELTYGDDEQ